MKTKEARQAMLLLVRFLLVEQIYSLFLAINLDFSAIKLPFPSSLMCNYVECSIVLRTPQGNGKIGIARGTRDID